MSDSASIPTLEQIHELMVAALDAHLMVHVENREIYSCQMEDGEMHVEGEDVEATFIGVREALGDRLLLITECGDLRPITFTVRPADLTIKQVRAFIKEAE